MQFLPENKTDGRRVRPSTTTHSHISNGSLIVMEHTHTDCRTENKWKSTHHMTHSNVLIQLELIWQVPL